MRGQDNPNRCEGSSPGHALRDEVVAALESFVSHHAPRWELPRTFGGHLVGPDAVADLAFTLGWLHQGGVDTIAGRPLVDALRDVMNQIDGPATHTFFSSRVAETIGRFGRFDDDNALVRGLDPTARANLAAACDSTEVLGLLDALPRNYLAVLARCELARERIGLLDDPETLSHLLAATRELLADNPSGYLDDSQERAGRYDIYTADLYLFCEPMAEELGEVWSRGMRSALDLVHTIASSDGSAFTWGRSTGALSRALTIELAAVALTTGFTAESELGGPAASPDAHAWWHEFGAMAAEGFIADWFGDDGVIAAHARAAVEAYRGPQRRLQMTFDVLGKLAEAAAREIGPRSPRAEAPAPGTFGHRDHLVRFDDRAGVWSFRDDSTEFVVPFVAGPSSDYVAAPRRPGLYGSPVDSTLAAFVPLIHRRGDALTPQRRFAATGAPRSLGHGQSRLDAAWDGFAALHPIDDSPPCEPIDGSRHLTISTDGATLNFSESLRFAETPESLTISVPEYGRPFRVRVDGHPARLVHADVSGVAEWRSAWGPARAVTEIELEPARAIDVAWSVTPIPVVSVFDNDHHYTRAVYGAVDSPGAGSVRTVDWRPGDPLGDVLH
ncbi:MAG: hypothetical protein GX868_06285, partial [Actinobacteria bacterium]|nr:hypothetical protein [Actinomycetota bacterium]